MSLRDLMRKAAVPMPASSAPTGGGRGGGGGGWGKRGDPVPNSRDLERIVALPRREPLDLKSDRAQAMVDLINERYSNGRPADSGCRCREIDPRRFMDGAIGCITSVLPVQAWTLYEMGLAGGTIGSVVVGGGKTLLNILAIYPLGVTKALALVPSNLLGQLWDDYQLLAEHFRVPSVWVEGIKKGRKYPGEPDLYVLPYGLLSRPGRSAYIDDLKPEAIICDETDKLADIRGSATARRVLRYYVDNPHVKFAGWTGSLTDKKMSEYCLDAATRVLTADLRWPRVDEIRVGDTLVGFGDNLKNTRLAPAVVEGIKVVRQPRVRIVTNKGVLTCSATHRWVLRGRPRTYHRKGYSQLGRSTSRPGWIDAQDVRPGDMLAYYVPPWELEDSREAGYLAGLLDGEGWVTARGLVGFAQNKGVVLERYKKGLEDMGITYTEDRQGGGKGECMRVLPNGTFGGAMRLLGSLRPSRLLEKAERTWLGKAPYGKHTTHARVLEVTLLDDGDVYAIQTSTGTLIAEGFLSHNSHLVVMALKDMAPVPHDPQQVTNWGTAIDVSETPADMGALRILLRPEDYLIEDETKAVRRAYSRRLSETLGVITTSENEVEVSDENGVIAGSRVEMMIASRPAPTIPDVVMKALESARDFVRPDRMFGARDDEEMDSPTEKARVIAEIASGVCNVWEFPPTDPTRKKFLSAAKGGVYQEEKVIEKWYEIRKIWNKSVRQQTLLGLPHFDSPYLCEMAAARHFGDAPKKDGYPEWDNPVWPHWRDIRKQVKPLAVSKRIHPYLAEDAAKWALETTGIVWYSVVEFGKWVSEISGLPMHGGGSKAPARLKAEKGDRSIIASIDSHGRGRNGLQFLFANQLVTQIPSSARRWEQLLGRLTRRGQRSEEVTLWLYLHVPELRAAIEQALKRSEYVQETVRMQQKLLTGWREHMEDE